jgi:hypothetical protein
MKAKVHAAVERAVWDEHENEDYPELYIVELDERLDELAASDDFLSIQAAVHVARLRADLGLPPDDETAHESQPPESPPKARPDRPRPGASAPIREPRKTRKTRNEPDSASGAAPFRVFRVFRGSKDSACGAHRP